VCLFCPHRPSPHGSSYRHLELSLLEPEAMLTDPVKELAEIRSKGTPDGIVLLSADNMEEWRFLISVLGEETVYRVSSLEVLS
jgi:hypothetical protein